MARKHTGEPITRVHLHLFSDDIQWLNDHFGDSYGRSRAVRDLVRSFRHKVEAKRQDIADAQDDLKVELPT